MKATLEFTLPDDDQDFDDASKGHEWHGMVEDIFERIRQRLKWGVDMPEAVVNELTELQQIMFDELNDRKLHRWA